MNNKNNSRISFLIACIALYFGLSEAVFAATGGGMPWETPLETIKDSLTGPTAMVISLLGVFGAGAALIFGGQMDEFLRKIVMIVLLVALMVAGSSILTTLFSASGAVI